MDVFSFRWHMGGEGRLEWFMGVLWGVVVSLPGGFCWIYVVSIYRF